MVGMESKEIVIDNNKEISEIVVVLKLAKNELEDVVVTGIFKKNKESYTGAVSTITEKELKTFGNKNLLTTIGNIDPSFNILSNNEMGSNPNYLPVCPIWKSCKTIAKPVLIFHSSYWMVLKSLWNG